MKKYGILLLIMAFFLVGCGNNKTKEVGDINNFQTVAINNGFNAENNKSAYANDDYITDAILATQEEITVEMVIYDNEESASKVQESQIKSFSNLSSTGQSLKREKGKNYYKYVLISNGYYMVSSRIDNTLIFTKTLLTNKEKVETILDNMGY